MGELHLEIIVDRLLREFRRRRERRPAAGRVQGDDLAAVRAGGSLHQADGRHGRVRDRRARGRAERDGQGLRVRERARHGGDSARVRRGRSSRAAARRCRAVISAGYPVVDVKLRLVDGAAHEVDSSERAFKIAGSMACNDALRQAKPVAARADDERRGRRRPKTSVGAVQGDLNSRRGRITGIEIRAGSAQVVHAEVPLAADVRLREQPAVDDAGPRDLHDAVFTTTRACPTRSRAGS